MVERLHGVCDFPNRMGRAVRHQHLGRYRKHLGERTLRHEYPTTAVFEEDGQSLAHKIVGFLVELAPLGEIKTGGRANAVIDGVGETRLEVGIEVGPAVDNLAVHAAGIESLLQVHDPLGQRPRLVRAQHGHGAKVLNGGQLLHNDLYVGHVPRAMREVDRDHGGKELGRDPDSQREREQEAVEHRFMQVDVDGENGHDQNQRHLHEEVAEPPDAPFELWFVGPLGEALRHPAKLGRRPRADDESSAASGNHMRSHEECAGAFRQGSLGRYRPGRFLHGKGLPGEGGLINVKIFGDEKERICGDSIPRGEDEDVARHDVCHRNIDAQAVSEDCGVHLDDGE